MKIIVLILSFTFLCSCGKKSSQVSSDPNRMELQSSKPLVEEVVLEDREEIDVETFLYLYEQIHSDFKESGDQTTILCKLENEEGCKIEVLQNSVFLEKNLEYTLGYEKITINSFSSECSEQKRNEFLRSYSKSLNIEEEKISQIGQPYEYVKKSVLKDETFELGQDVVVEHYKGKIDSDLYIKVVNTDSEGNKGSMSFNTNREKKGMMYAYENYNSKKRLGYGANCKAEPTLNVDVQELDLESLDIIVN